MSPRTTPSQWAALFNFAGGGLVHMELFTEALVTLTNPTLFEAIASYLIAFGTHSLRPAAADAPLNALYFETDTNNGYQNQNAAWVLIAGTLPPSALPQATVTRSAVQNIPHYTWTALEWSAAPVDTDSFWTASPNPEDLTIPADGRYLIGAGCIFDGGSTIDRDLRILLNGTDVLAQQSASTNPGSPTSIQVTAARDLVATDVLTIEARAYEVGGINIGSTPDPETYATITALSLT